MSKPTYYSPFNPPSFINASTNNRPKHQYYGNLHGCSLTLLASQLAKQHSQSVQAPTLLITPDMTLANELIYELRLFTDNTTTNPPQRFPDWETLPYDQFSPHQDIIAQRLTLFYQLPRLTQGVIIVPITACLQKLPPRHYIEKNSFILSIGDCIDPIQLRDRLQKYGYQVVQQVTHPGEISVRGGIIDVFPPVSQYPIRLELFDNTVEHFRFFDTDTQLSLKNTDVSNSIEILPARECPLDPNSITHFRQAWRSLFSGNPSKCPVYQSVSQGISVAGIEYYLPLFFEETATLLDYLPNNSLILMTASAYDLASNYWEKIQARYEQYGHDITRPLLPPSQLFTPANVLMETMKSFPCIQLQSSPVSNKPSQGYFNFNTAPLPDISIQSKSSQPLKHLQAFLSENQSTHRILFCAETVGRREAMLELLSTIEVHPTPTESWSDFMASSDLTIGIITWPMDQGLWIQDSNMVLICEAQLFGQQVMQRRRRRPTQSNQDDNTLFVRNLVELTPGDLVVHSHHGIGRYVGLETIKTQTIESEYLTLEYADNNKLYVPIDSLDLITRYTGHDPEQVGLSHLGSKKWEKTKEKAAKRIKDTAVSLLHIYAQRAMKSGFCFKKPDADYALFSKAFPFEETFDQTRTIEAIINDMVSAHCMDRLVCGDVGFGKTEVAMRAAFLCVKSYKQVMVLTPTTLLAHQHCQSFKDRFVDWPIKIEQLSRLQTLTEQRRIVQGLKSGEIDIIIGTHKLLQKSIAFKDLGLLVIDEEHRFGVRQKEYIKSLKSHVDTLALTATPIPRTLNMSLTGLRDISIIATPPQRRLSVKTFVCEYNKTLITEAMQRELLRGGQVYFLHNNVQDIDHAAQALTQLLPEARIAVAHGKMPKSTMQRIMRDFYHQRFNVLVCTTIIESGIDIPNANTIIIENAHKFGLAQLHQIRGRVGRSHHQAYAYLIAPPKNQLSRDAVKRLDAIVSLDALGAGFMLASNDLEIRGSGEILGDEQSGQIQAIGFSLYMDMLNATIRSLKSGQLSDSQSIDNFDPTQLHQTTTLDFNTSALIPTSYLDNAHTRLLFYKRIASAKTQANLKAIKIEMIDRFGLLTDPINNLFKITELKLKIREHGIKNIQANKNGGQLEFWPKAKINPEKIIQLIQTRPETYTLTGSHGLKFKLDNIQSLDDRLRAVENILGLIT